MKPRAVLALVLAPITLLACQGPSKEYVRARIADQTRRELQGASLESLVAIADERGIDVNPARALLAAPAERAAGEAAEKDRLSGLIADDTGKKEASAVKSFYGVNFGIAPSVLFGGPEEVRAATLVDTGGGTSVVHVTESDDDSAALLLETHYFFQPPKLWDTYAWGTGPFLGIQVSEEDILQGLGFGWMVGFRYGETARSFNIGLGMFLDEDVQTLASGFSDGQAPPTGETQVRFDKEDAWRGALVFSFAWGI
jgi:hypothetical protein